MLDDDQHSPWFSNESAAGSSPGDGMLGWHVQDGAPPVENGSDQDCAPFLVNGRLIDQLMMLMMANNGQW